jgi:hypothetical protein
MLRLCRVRQTHIQVEHGNDEIQRAHLAEYDMSYFWYSTASAVG